MDAGVVIVIAVLSGAAAYFAMSLVFASGMDAAEARVMALARGRAPSLQIAAQLPQKVHSPRLKSTSG